MISIIMPVYNGERFVADAIGSILMQTIADWELIVVNDGSTDGTQAVLECFAGDPRIRLLRKENGGVSSARNAGIAAATGEYLAFLDAGGFQDQFSSGAGLDHELIALVLVSGDDDGDGLSFPVTGLRVEVGAEFRHVDTRGSELRSWMGVPAGELHLHDFDDFFHVQSSLWIWHAVVIRVSSNPPTFVHAGVIMRMHIRECKQNLQSR